MTEFWVHTPKHYCTFCDIWIDDNKPSIMHHERGMRHQENVKKRMIDMKKKQTEADDTMKELERMHEAALAAVGGESKTAPETVSGVVESAMKIAIGPTLPPDTVVPKGKGSASGAPAAAGAGATGGRRTAKDLARERELREMHMAIYRRFQVHPDWMAMTDQATGTVYYVNKITGATQWNRPLLTEAEIETAEQARIAAMHEEEHRAAEQAEAAEAALRRVMEAQTSGADPSELPAPVYAQLPVTPLTPFPIYAPQQALPSAPAGRPSTPPTSPPTSPPSNSLPPAQDTFPQPDVSASSRAAAPTAGMSPAASGSGITQKKGATDDGRLRGSERKEGGKKKGKEARWPSEPSPDEEAPVLGAWVTCEEPSAMRKRSEELKRLDEERERRKNKRDGKHAGEGDTGAVEHTEGTEDAGDEDLATLNVEVPADDDPNRMLPQLRRAREHARKGDPSPPTPTASAVTGAQLSPLPEADRRTRPRLGDSGAASTAGSAAKQEPGAPAPPVPPATLTAAKAETASPTAVKTESKLVFAHQGTAVAPDQGLFGRPSFGM